ncbi:MULTISPECIES: hypothetical protein [Francisella]|uniref:GH15-like domain-containing protein n=1 Tax=Francisella opportunistica TaxID=2016517 RepID=A0A345JRZ6_9GAMM|nr:MULTISPECIES: hypothetical protein [Francisella]APC91850.1 hypothetical protein BBG19_1116 [Francisella sp. MA067296]AXH30092.1 hypothetical protein CGC43_05600 [Francisella opportunistica]AXH31736.1 hypothetical protein CGC44_05590 [Francisella opportunistica]AXH33382.1 hypothetical protein CGC45_05600 [Francisella opportunistica]
MSNINQIKKFIASSEYNWYSIEIPEGGKVNYSNKSLEIYLSKKLTSAQALAILQQFHKTFDIALTQTGFAKAAERDIDDDTTNYDAVWVRDAVWVYYYLSEFNQRQAKVLINKLFAYYDSPQQKQRFEAVIKNPKIAEDKMAVPHVRFDSTSANYDDVIINGKPQVWNHKQVDAYGLFLLALEDAYQKQILDTNDSQLLIFLERFFSFFKSINYSEYADAGAWEEIDRVNTSSISLVANASKRWKDSLSKKNLKLKVDLELLYTQGINKVKNQIAYGGESPLYDLNDIRYRQSDAAMLHIFTPYFIEGLDFAEYQKSLAYIDALIRDYGVIRYVNDSYQAANFWLDNRNIEKESLTDDASTPEQFIQRAVGQLRDSEAQWFFDSMIALAMMNLYDKYPLQIDKVSFFNKIVWHLKRALAQMTGETAIAADGHAVAAELLPESINTVIFADKKYFLASPITPLNWAKASLALALKKFSTYTE